MRRRRRQRERRGHGHGLRSGCRSRRCRSGWGWPRDAARRVWRRHGRHGLGRPDYGWPTHGRRGAWRRAGGGLLEAGEHHAAARCTTGSVCAMVAAATTASGDYSGRADPPRQIRHGQARGGRQGRDSGSAQPARLGYPHGYERAGAPGRSRQRADCGAAGSGSGWLHGGIHQRRFRYAGAA